MLQPTDAALIPFSLLWGGFAFYWEYEVVTTRQFWVLQLWGIPFVLVGLYLVEGFRTEREEDNRADRSRS